jgi:hypothetical protein
MREWRWRRQVAQVGGFAVVSAAGGTVGAGNSKAQNATTAGQWHPML